MSDSIVYDQSAAVEALDKFNQAASELTASGVKYDLQLVLFNDPDNPTALISSSDSTTFQQTLQVCQLEDGSHRLIRHHSSSTPGKTKLTVDYVGVDGSHGHEEAVERHFQAIENIFNY